MKDIEDNTLRSQLTQASFCIGELRINRFIFWKQ
jgi:hypothetical protein